MSWEAEIFLFPMSWEAEMSTAAPFIYFLV